MNLLFLYAEFFKIGLFSIGGGLATLPFIFRMTDGFFSFIKQTGWINMEFVGNFIAIAQSSPGAVGVNIATQTGFLYAGIPGGAVAALGLVSPAIVVIIAVARFLKKFEENRIVVSVFSGLRPAATGLLTAAGFGVWKLALYNSSSEHLYDLIRWKEFAIFAVIFLLIIKTRGNPVIFIILGAITGILLGL